MKHKSMKQVPRNERPYERFLLQGPASLSDAELLAIVLRTGYGQKSAKELAEELLAQYENQVISPMRSILNLPLEELTANSGIGTVKAIMLGSIAEICRRYEICDYDRPPCFDCPAYVADYFIPKLSDLEREEVHVIALDNRLRLLHETRLSMGSVNTTMLSTRDILIEVLTRKAVYMMIVHNHPSGNPEPSTADLESTRSVMKAAELINVPLIDHIIVGKNNYYSMKEHHLLDG